MDGNHTWNAKLCDLSQVNKPCTSCPRVQVKDVRPPLKDKVLEFTQSFVADPAFTFVLPPLAGITQYVYAVPHIFPGFKVRGCNDGGSQRLLQ
jgi:hypothetical protein